MGKAGKWIRNFLAGKKEKEKDKCSTPITNLNSPNGTENPTTPISTTPKEKKRWSFRRSSASATMPTTASRELNFAESNNVTASQTAAQSTTSDAQNEQRKHAMAVAAATAAAADAAEAAAQAAAAVIRLTSGSNGTDRSIEEGAALKIQSVFRSHLARKALCALRGLVKLQALVRGHLVRKQAKATLRCMQALLTAQARARAQRIRMAAPEGNPYQKHLYSEMERGMEDNNIKIVEMDFCESQLSNSRSRSRSSSVYNNNGQYHQDLRFSTNHSPNASSYSKEENNYYKVSPAASAMTDFEECFSTAQNSPQCYSAVSRIGDDSKHNPFSFPRPPPFAETMSYDYSFFPNYMANTESSRAKARSHSAPKQRPDSFERQPSGRRRASVEGRNVPRPVRMQRSSSHVGSTAQNYQYPPWSTIKLDRSGVSLKDSECGSTSTVLTNTNYCRSLVAYDPNGDRY